MLCQAGPDFRALHHITVTLEGGSALQGCQIRARAGFGIALGPEGGALLDAWQPTSLLRGRAKRADHGPHIDDAHGHRVDGAGQFQFLIKDILLVGIPTGAALFLGPVHTQPAFGRQCLLRALVVCFIQGKGAGGFFDQVLWILMGKKVSHFGAKVLVISVEIHVQVQFPSEWRASGGLSMRFKSTSCSRQGSYIIDIEQQAYGFIP